MARVWTPLQTRVLSLLLGRGFFSDHGYFLTGGNALSEFDLGHRFSDDLDFFCHDRPDVRPDAEVVAGWLRDEGLTVEKLDLRSTGFARLHVLDPASGEPLILDFGTDPHLIDPQRNLEGLPVDSSRDMAARKLVAFFERGEEEAKDAVDLFFLLTQAGWSLADLIALARRKTADFDGEDGLLILASELIHCSEPAYLDRMRRLRFVPGREPDVAEMGQRLREEGERLLERLRPGYE